MKWRRKRVLLTYPGKYFYWLCFLPKRITAKRVIEWPKNGVNFWDPKQEHKTVHCTRHVGFVLITENKVRQLLPLSPESHKIPIFCVFLSLLVLTVTMVWNFSAADSSIEHSKTLLEEYLFHDYLCKLTLCELLAYQVCFTVSSVPRGELNSSSCR
jgi:hypothetical protein